MATNDDAKPADNEEVAEALAKALEADENAIAVGLRSEQAIDTANAEIKDARERLADAEAGAKSAWSALLGKLRDRAARSPVQAGELGTKVLVVLLLVCSLVLFTGCSNSGPQLVREVEGLQDHVDANAYDIRDALRNQTDAVKANTAAVGELLKEIRVAERVATLENQQATLQDLAMQYRESVDGRLAKLETQDEKCPCSDFPSAIGPPVSVEYWEETPPPPCFCDRLSPPTDLPSCPPPRNPASESDSPAPAELTPPAKKPARACPKRKPRV